MSPPEAAAPLGMLSRKRRISSLLAWLAGAPSLIYTPNFSESKSLFVPLQDDASSRHKDDLPSVSVEGVFARHQRLVPFGK